MSLQLKTESVEYIVLIPKPSINLPTNKLPSNLHHPNILIFHPYMTSQLHI